MFIVPHKEQKDHLHNIIGFARFYFNNKYVRWWSNYCFITSGVYLLCLLHSLFYNSAIITEQELYYTALVLEVISSKLSLDYAQQKLTALNTIRLKYFWSNDFLTSKEKQMFTTKINFFVFFIFILWLLICVLTIISFVGPFQYPKPIHREEWPNIVRRTAEILIFLLFVGGYYIGNASLCYCVYIILHSYFQMIILRAYIAKAVKKYERIPLKDKMFNKSFQWEMGLIFKRSIRQYQKLKWYGDNVGLLCSQVSPSHFLSSTLVMAIGLHSILFVQAPSQRCVVMGIIHIVYGALYYIGVGQLFSETNADLRIDLEKMDWYTLDINNQKLYYMFLMYTQKEQAIQILPSIHLTRPVVTQFIKTIYTVITLLRSINK